MCSLTASLGQSSADEQDEMKSQRRRPHLVAVRARQISKQHVHIWIAQRAGRGRQWSVQRRPPEAHPKALAAKRPAQTNTKRVASATWPRSSAVICVAGKRGNARVVVATPCELTSCSLKTSIAVYMDRCGLDATLCGPAS